MKTLTVGLLAHYAQDVTTIATCWLVIRKDLTIFGFTDASNDLVIGAVTYKASTGFIPSATQTSSQFNVDNLEVQGIMSSDAIREVDIAAGLWDYAKVSVFEVNYMDVTMGINPIRNGYLGQVSTARNQFTSELRGLLQFLQQPSGRSFGVTCDANFCDTRCTLSQASWTSTGSITSMSSGRTLTCALTNPTWKYTGGLLTMTSGPATGFSMEIRSYTAPSSIILQELFPFAPQPGNTFSIFAGCDKLKTTCADVYANIPNFRGFPDLPGQDAVTSGK